MGSVMVQERKHVEPAAPAVEGGVDPDSLLADPGERGDDETADAQHDVAGQSRQPEFLQDEDSQRGRIGSDRDQRDSQAKDRTAKGQQKQSAKKSQPGYPNQ